MRSGTGRMPASKGSSNSPESRRIPGRNRVASVSRSSRGARSPPASTARRKGASQQAASSSETQEKVRSGAPPTPRRIARAATTMEPESSPPDSIDPAAGTARRRPFTARKNRSRNPSSASAPRTPGRAAAAAPRSQYFRSRRPPDPTTIRWAAGRRWIPSHIDSPGSPNSRTSTRASAMRASRRRGATGPSRSRARAEEAAANTPPASSQ